MRWPHREGAQGRQPADPPIGFDGEAHALFNSHLKDGGRSIRKSAACRLCPWPGQKATAVEAGGDLALGAEAARIPMAEAFPRTQNPGIDLDVEGVPAPFNYYADVFYGDHYETEFQSYYEQLDAANETEVPSENIEKVAGEITPPQPETRVTDGSSRIRAQAERAADTADAAVAPAAPAGGTNRGNWRLRRGCRRRCGRPLSSAPPWRPTTFCSTRSTPRPDGETFQVREELRSAGCSRSCRPPASRPRKSSRHAQHGHDGRLRRVRNCPDCPPVDTLFTLGSPLGVKGGAGRVDPHRPHQVDFPAATLRRWINVYDPLDVVCGADPILANDFAAVEGREVEDVKESNWGNWRHTITHYFAGREVPRVVRASHRCRTEMKPVVAQDVAVALKRHEHPDPPLQILAEAASRIADELAPAGNKVPKQDIRSHGRAATPPPLRPHAPDRIGVARLARVRRPHPASAGAVGGGTRRFGPRRRAAGRGRQSGGCQPKGSGLRRSGRGLPGAARADPQAKVRAHRGRQFGHCETSPVPVSAPTSLPFDPSL